MGARKVVVEIVGDSKGYSKATDEAITTTSRLNASMERMNTRLKGMSRDGGIPGALLGGVGLGAGVALFGTVKNAIGGVVDILGDAVQAAKEDEAATARLNTMLQANIRSWDGNTAAIEDQIDAAARLAFADDEVREGLNELVPRTRDLNEALRLNSLAMDLARAKGMGLGEAAQLIGKAYSGQVGALRRAGVAISANLKPTEALAQLQRQVAGQAKTYANTAAGAAEAVQIQISESMEAIGYALIPLVAGITSFAADTIPVVISALGGLGDAFNNLHRFMDPGLAAQQDFERAVLAQAAAAGVSAAAVIKNTEALRLQAQVEKDREDNYKTFEGFARTALGLFGDLTEAQQKQVDEWIRARQAEEGLAFVNDGYLTDLQAQADANAKATHAIAQHKLAIQGIVDAFNAAGSSSEDWTNLTYQQIKILSTNKDLLLAEFDNLPETVRDAMVKAGIAVGQGAAMMGEGADEATTAMLRLKHSGKTVPRQVQQDLSPLAGIVKGTLKKAKEEARAGMAELNWSLKHPLQGAKLERFYENQMDKAYRKLRKAQREGNIDAIAKAQALIDGLRSKLSELRSVRISIQTTLDNRAEHRATPGGSRMEYRAAGGPVKKNKAYIVGERRAEVFVPEDDGMIVPDISRMRGWGGGPTGGSGSGSPAPANVTVNIVVGPTADRAAIGRELVQVLRAYSVTDGGVALKAAMSGR